MAAATAAVAAAVASSTAACLAAALDGPAGAFVMLTALDCNGAFVTTGL
jgi:hypothetical protein